MFSLLFDQRIEGEAAFHPQTLCRSIVVVVARIGEEFVLQLWLLYLRTEVEVDPRQLGACGDIQERVLLQ